MGKVNAIFKNEGKERLKSAPGFGDGWEDGQLEDGWGKQVCGSHE